MALMLLTGAALAVPELHGAGTTNPRRLFWSVMDMMESQTRSLVHLTYRAVGSSTGQNEFVGATNNNQPLNDFGAGDIPMSASRFAAVTAAGREMIHVPFALGAIGVFHSVPVAERPASGSIHLTGCVLAKIFSAQITAWNDPEILALNPGMTAAGTIKVVHRVRGSSSTAGFTQYLASKCPESWNLYSGSTITWPETTNEAQGSGGMATFIEENTYAIGYIDAGHGHRSNLGEIALQNRDLQYLTTTEADIGAAAQQGLASNVIPTNPDADFSAVNLYDLAGPTTWPITMISYFYIAKNLTAMPPETAGLLMAFVNYILSPAGQAIASNAQNMFDRLPQEMIDYNTNSLAQLSLPAGTPTYIIETASETQSEVGAGPYVLSGKRNTYAVLDRGAMSDSIASLTTSITALQNAPSDQARRDETRTFALIGMGTGIGGLVLGFVALLIAVCKPSNSATPTLSSVQLEKTSTGSFTNGKDSV